MVNLYERYPVRPGTFWRCRHGHTGWTRTCWRCGLRHPWRFIEHWRTLRRGFNVINFAAKQQAETTRQLLKDKRS